MISKDQMVEAVYSTLLFGEASSMVKFRALMHQLHLHEQRTMLYAMIRIVSKQRFSTDKSFNVLCTQQANTSTISGLAALLTGITEDNPALKDALVEWLTAISGGGIGQTHDTHRAVIVAIAPDQGMSEGFTELLGR